MKNFKRIIKSSFAIVLALIMLFGVACKKNDSGDLDVSPRPPEEKSIYFNQKNLAMSVGDISTLVVLGSLDGEGQTLIYTSADPSVATVSSNGKVEAIDEGTTKIIASYGNLTAECPVTVDYVYGELPTISTSFVENSMFNIVKDDTYKFEPKIKYRNRIYEDGTFTYEMSNPNVVEISADGTAQALASGQTEITIKGSWRAFDNESYPSIKTVVTIKVVDDVKIEVENIQTDFVELYTLAQFNGQNYQNQVSFVPTVKINGVEQPSTIADITVANTDIAVYQSGKIVGKAFGSTTVDIEVGEGQDKYVKQYVINVLRPQAKLNKVANFFSSYKGTLRDETKSYTELTLAQFIYGEATEKDIVDATVDGKPLQVVDNKVLGITGTDSQTYNVTVSVGSATEIYNVDLVVYGVYIYSLADFDVFVRGEDNRQLDCYVELARDLDANNLILRNHFYDNPDSLYKPTVSKNYEDEIKGFTGTFDGKGHSIKNLTTGEFGLMCVTYHATIKNVAFENVNINGGGLFAENVMFTDFENVYIKVASMAKIAGGSNVISKFVVSGGFFKNIFIDAQAIAKDQELLQGAFLAIEIGTLSAATPLFENCFILSELPAGISTHTSTWGQLAIAENVYNDPNNRKDALDFIWNNYAFEDMKKTITSTYQESFPGSEVTSSAILDVGKLHSLSGVKAFVNYDSAKADSQTSKLFASFISDEHWSLVDGFLVWGPTKLNADPGQIYLNVGTVQGNMVSGFDGNPLTPAIGSTVKLPKLDCFGYKFVGWKDYQTGEIIKANAQGDYIATPSYDGKAMEFVAIWEKKPGISTGSDVWL